MKKKVRRRERARSLVRSPLCNGVSRRRRRFNFLLFRTRFSAIVEVRGQRVVYAGLWADANLSVLRSQSNFATYGREIGGAGGGGTDLGCSSTTTSNVETISLVQDLNSAESLLNYGA